MYVVICIQFNFVRVFHTALNAVGNLDTRCSSNEYVIISTNVIQKLIPKESRQEPYPFNLQLPEICLSNDGTCRALLEKLSDGRKLFWVPNVGHVRFYQLSDTPPYQIISSSELSAQDCFNYFPISDQVIGVICLRSTPDEFLVVPYKITVTADDIHSNKLSGVELHINVGDHLPFINLIDDSGSVVLYVTYVEHLSAYKLVIIRFGAAKYDSLDIPSGCIDPHRLQPVGDRDAILGCTNGKLFYYNGDNLALTEMLYDNIATVSNCGNTTSFVMVQNTHTIIYNRTGETYVLLVEPSPPSITSAVCYSHGSDVLYYFTTRENDAVYWIDLEDFFMSENKRTTAPEVLLNASDHNNGPINLCIDGQVLWRKNALQNNVTSVYLFDLIAEQHSHTFVSGSTVFVQLYKATEKCNEVPLIVVDPAESVINTKSNTKDMLITILSILSFLVLVAVVVSSAVIIYVMYRRGM